MIFDLNKISFDVGFGPGDPSYISKYTSIEIPANLVYNKIINKSGIAFIGVGPYVGLNLFGGSKLIHYDGERFGKVRDLTFGRNKNLKLMDYGMNGLVGYKANSGILFNVGYSLGLANIYGVEEVEGTTISIWKNRVVSLGIGYAF